MNFLRYSIPASSFPRYRYTRKVGKDLAKRYNNLNNAIVFEDAPQVRNLSDAEIEDVSIFLSKSLLTEEHFSGVSSFCLSYDKVKKDHKVERFNLEAFFKSQLLNSNSFVVTSKSDIVANIDSLEHFPGHIILIAENETYEKAFPHTERKNIHVCLVETVREVISTHLERCALTGLKGACEFLEDLLNPDGSNNRHAEITKQCHKTITEGLNFYFSRFYQRAKFTSTPLYKQREIDLCDSVIYWYTNIQYCPVFFKAVAFIKIEKIWRESDHQRHLAADVGANTLHKVVPDCLFAFALISTILSK